MIESVDGLPVNNYFFLSQTSLDPDLLAEIIPYQIVSGVLLDLLPPNSLSHLREEKGMKVLRFIIKLEFFTNSVIISNQNLILGCVFRRWLWDNCCPYDEVSPMIGRKWRAKAPSFGTQLVLINRRDSNGNETESPPKGQSSLQDSWGAFFKHDLVLHLQKQLF